MEHQAPGRRHSDVELKTLAERVEIMDKDVQFLRVEFNDFKMNKKVSDEELKVLVKRLDDKIEGHLERDEIQHTALNSNIASIQNDINKLAADLIEPLEVYKTAKYSFKGTKFVAETLKWLVPIIALVSAILLGFNALQIKQLDTISNTQTDNKNDNQTTLQK